MYKLHLILLCMSNRAKGFNTTDTRNIFRKEKFRLFDLNKTVSSPSLIQRRIVFFEEFPIFLANLA